MSTGNSSKQKPSGMPLKAQGLATFSKAPINNLPASSFTYMHSSGTRSTGN